MGRRANAHTDQIKPSITSVITQNLTQAGIINTRRTSVSRHAESPVRVWTREQGQRLFNSIFTYNKGDAPCCMTLTLHPQAWPRKPWPQQPEPPTCQKSRSGDASKTAHCQRIASDEPFASTRKTCSTSTNP